MSSPPAPTLLLTSLAMLAFSANSLLARQALSTTPIDPALFTVIRLASGALALAIYVRIAHGVRNPARRGSWLGAASLFVYGAAFSFAYVTLSAATGALILFASVQATMLGYGFVQGERLAPRQSIGLGVSLLGFLLLVAPGVAPSLPERATSSGMQRSAASRPRVRRRCS